MCCSRAHVVQGLHSHSVKYVLFPGKKKLEVALSLQTSLIEKDNIAGYFLYGGLNGLCSEVRQYYQLATTIRI